MILKHIIFFISVIVITGCTTLHTAASKGNVKAIDRLVKEEANIDETDSMGKTPLMYAVIMNQKESLVALLKAGADINTQSDSGNTALHEAVLQGNLKFASLLLEKGADISLRNKQGETALDLADGHKTFVDLFSHYVKEKPSSTFKAPIKTIEPVTKSSSVDVIEPIPVIVPSIAPVTVELPKETPVEINSVKISDEEAKVRLKKMIAGRETLGIRNFLNEFPHAIQFIEDPMQRIRYVGPHQWRIIDIIENMGRCKMNEGEVINHILSANLPYKQFSSDEYKMLNRYGISNSIIDAMVKVTK